MVPPPPQKDMENIMQVFSIIYRLAIALWVGGIALFTFVVTPMLFKTQGRDLAGRMVGEIFPAYFRWGLVCGSIALLCLLITRGRNFAVTLPIVLAMLLLTSFEAFYLEPHLAALKREITSFESTPRNHPLRQQFSRLHGLSATSNLTVFAGGVALIVLL